MRDEGFGCADRTQHVGFNNAENLFVGKGLKRTGEAITGVVEN